MFFHQLLELQNRALEMRPCVKEVLPGSVGGALPCSYPFCGFLSVEGIQQCRGRSSPQPSTPGLAPLHITYTVAVFKDLLTAWLCSVTLISFLWIMLFCFWRIFVKITLFNPVIFFFLVPFYFQMEWNIFWSSRGCGGDTFSGSDYIYVAFFF